MTTTETDCGVELPPAGQALLTLKHALQSLQPKQAVDHMIKAAAFLARSPALTPALDENAFLELARYHFRGSSPDVPPSSDAPFDLSHTPLD